jgi:hypothetical protein
MKNLFLKLVILLFSVIFIFVAMLLLSQINFKDEASSIKKEIDKLGYCQINEDCVEIVGKCPFGCYIYTNIKEVKKVKKLINSYESKCVYNCVESSGYDCVKGRCVSMIGGNNIGDIINSFKECVQAGNPVMESYPRQCRAGDRTFTENIGNEVEKRDLIIISYPRPNEEIESPLVIRGQARGYWFFEGDFPVVLTNWDGLIIGEGYATAKGEWMTDDFIDFEGVLKFKKPNVYNTGTLILQRDNPSGMPENDDALEVPVIFK